MLCVVTSVHDPADLTATCCELGLDLPEERFVRLDGETVFGWAVRLPGLRFPAVFDTLTGLVAHHPSDNAFSRYDQLMRFILRCYAVRARLQWTDDGHAAHHEYGPMPAKMAV